MAITAAGISAQSGIPTYRGDGGVWHGYGPYEHANIEIFLQDPSFCWRFFRDVRYPLLRQAEPNPTHRALARLERQGLPRVVVTQKLVLDEALDETRSCDLYLVVGGSPVVQPGPRRGARAREAAKTRRAPEVLE